MDMRLETDRSHKPSSLDGRMQLLTATALAARKGQLVTAAFCGLYASRLNDEGKLDEHYQVSFDA